MKRDEIQEWRRWLALLLATYDNDGDTPAFASDAEARRYAAALLARLLPAETLPYRRAAIGVTDGRKNVTPIGAQPHCAACRVCFVPKRRDALYCSSRCRQQAYRTRR